MAAMRQVNVDDGPRADRDRTRRSSVRIGIEAVLAPACEPVEVILGGGVQPHVVDVEHDAMTWTDDR
jgi:hypothetical protein